MFENSFKNSTLFKKTTKLSDTEHFKKAIAHLKTQINPALKFFYETAHTIKVAFGGRGAGKSWVIALCILLLCLTKKIKVLCLRIYQTSLEDSVYSALKDMITLYDLEPYFKVLNNKIKCFNGSEIIFKGMQHITSVKSLHNIDIAWIEEAVGTGKAKEQETLNKDQWEILEPSIRKKGSQIWLSFNPSFAEDFPYEEWAAKVVDSKIYDDGYTYIRKINFDENPHFNSSSLAEKEEKARGTSTYNHVWLGECEVATEGFPFREINIDKFDYASLGSPQIAFLDPQFGGSDYNGLSMVWIKNKHYYILSRGWKGGKTKTIEVLQECINDYGLKEIIVESNNRGTEVAKSIQIMLPKLIVSIYLSKGDKYERITNTLAPFIDKMTIHPLSDRIIDIKNYHSRITHDDQIDSLSSAILLLTNFKEYDRMMKETREAIASGDL